MKLDKFTLIVLAAIFLVRLTSCSLPLKNEGKKQLLEYEVALEAEDWLRNVATQPYDSQFNTALHEMRIVHVEGDRHPLGPFIAVVTNYGWTSNLGQWFPEIVDSDAGAVIELMEAYEDATARLHAILQKRLEASHVEVKQIDIVEKARVRLQVYAEDEDMERRLLLPKGNVGFYETYTYQEVIGGLRALRDTTLHVDSMGHGFDFFRLIYPFDTNTYLDPRQLPSFQADYPLVGYVADSDVTELDSFLRNTSPPGMLPGNIAFSYSIDAVQDWPEVYPLIALKLTSSGGPRLDGSCIIHASPDFEPNSNRPLISIRMDEEGAAEWRRMTRYNLGRQVAIVVDGIVYCYPTVQGEITGGRSQITGNFTLEEARNLAQIIASGAYPANIIILEKKVL